MSLIPKLRIMGRDSDFQLITAEAASRIDATISQCKDYFSKMSTSPFIDKVLEGLAYLNAEQKRELIDKLAAAGLGHISAGAKATRYSCFAATAEKTEMAPAIKLACGQLKRVGLTLEAVLDGGVAAVDKATKERQTPLEDRMAIKASLRLIRAL